MRTGLKAAVRQAGIGKLHIHHLRHTTAGWTLSEGIPVAKVAQVLGHPDISVTCRTFGPSLPERMADAVPALDFSLRERNSRPAWVQRTAKHYANPAKTQCFLVGDEGLEPPTSSV
ncbi:tyrosine-type recombinase/integrase [Tropicibacter sp. S64]|uniref:tyrosine-type recombinase/integrase n=1 Tax=Tropicibacter sp. S64 TaxID=3415122 RepID=UPI003C79AEC0